jgi:hypothetical protein
MKDLGVFAQTVTKAKLIAGQENSTLFDKEKLKDLTQNLNILEREELMQAMKDFERKRKKRAELAGKSRTRREEWIGAKIEILGSNIIKDE